MVLPLRLIWNLQMKRAQKLSIGGLFCVGWICIIVATIRVAQLGSSSADGTPLPSWLALWGIIEASVGKLLPGHCCVFADSPSSSQLLSLEALPASTAFLRPASCLPDRPTICMNHTASAVKPSPPASRHGEGTFACRGSRRRDQ
jgi:hypothetical protein